MAINWLIILLTVIIYIFHWCKHHLSSKTDRFFPWKFLKKAGNERKERQQHLPTSLKSDPDDPPQENFLSPRDKPVCLDCAAGTSVQPQPLLLASVAGWSLTSFLLVHQKHPSGQSRWEHQMLRPGIAAEKSSELSRRPEPLGWLRPPPAHNLGWPHPWWHHASQRCALPLARVGRERQWGLSLHTAGLVSPERKHHNTFSCDFLGSNYDLGASQMLSVHAHH